MEFLADLLDLLQSFRNLLLGGLLAAVVIAAVFIGILIVVVVAAVVLPGLLDIELEMD